MSAKRGKYEASEKRLYSARQLRMLTCACGEEFATNGSKVIRCPECRRAYDAIRNRTRYKVRTGQMTKAEANDVIERYYAAYVAARKEKGYKGALKAAVVITRTCPYCGRTHRSPESDYCATCRREGFAAIHQITGRTNGWEVRGLPTPTVVGGWRGRRVMGSGHHVGGNTGAW